MKLGTADVSKIYLGTAEVSRVMLGASEVWSAFSPLDLSPALWFDAADGSTLFTTSGGSTPSSNGSNVGRWEDKSGNSWHATAVSVAILLANSENGLNAVSFDGINDLFSVSSSALDIFRNKPQGYIFAVCRDTAPRAGHPGHNVVHASIGGNASGFVRATLQTRNASNAFAAPGRRLDADGSTASSNTGTDTNTDSLVLLEHHSNWGDGNARLIINGAAQTASDYVSGAGNSQNTASAAIFIGGSGAADRYFPGRVCEVLFFNAALTSGQLVSVRQYLANKWGITLT